MLHSPGRPPCESPSDGQLSKIYEVSAKKAKEPGLIHHSGNYNKT